MKRFICMVLILLFVLGAAACKKTPEPPLPEPDPEIPAPVVVLQQLEKACNELDIDAALECIDPAHTQKIKSVLGVAGLFLSDEQILEKAVSMYLKDEASSVNVVEVCKTLQAEPGEVKTETETATMQAAVSYQNAGVSYEGDVELAFICREGTWYVTGVTVL